MKKFFYRVTENDTALSVAQKFNVSVCKLIKDNNLSGEIEAGDLLFIEQNDKTLYKVKPTDTLKTLAEKFNKTESDILEENGVPYIFCGLIISI